MPVLITERERYEIPIPDDGNPVTVIRDGREIKIRFANIQQGDLIELERCCEQLQPSIEDLRARQVEQVRLRQAGK